MVKEIYKELMRSGKRVAIICSSGIAGKGRFFHDSDISKKMGRLVTRQTILVLFYYFFLPFKFMLVITGVSRTRVVVYLLFKEYCFRVRVRVDTNPNPNPNPKTVFFK